MPKYVADTADPTTSRSVRTGCDNHWNNFIKQTIEKEDRYRSLATGTLPPLTPRAESPRASPRYWKLPPTPESPFAKRTPIRFDRVPQPRSEMLDESQHCARRAVDRSGLATPGRVVVGQGYSPRWNATIQQSDFSPRTLPRGVTEFRRGASQYSDPNVFTAYLRESVRKRVDLTCTGHPV